MKNLWTPWRMKHVTGEDNTLEGCLFEPHGANSFDKKQLLLHRSSAGLVLLNRFPYTNGHLLVAPNSHVGCLTQLEDTERDSLFLLVKESAAIIKQCLNPDGLNIGMNIGEDAGAGIADHLHVHIVPRWSGDHNFMTVLADVRTIPDHIDNTFDILLPYFLKIFRNDHE